MRLVSSFVRITGVHVGQQPFIVSRGGGIVETVGKAGLLPD